MTIEELRMGVKAEVQQWLCGSPGGKREDAMTRHVQIQQGSGTGQQWRGSTRGAEGLSLGRLRQTSSHI